MHAVTVPPLAGPAAGLCLQAIAACLALSPGPQFWASFTHRQTDHIADRMAPTPPALDALPHSFLPQDVVLLLEEYKRLAKVFSSE